jgi:hypothetical protein
VALVGLLKSRIFYLNKKRQTSSMKKNNLYFEKKGESLFPVYTNRKNFFLTSVIHSIPFCFEEIIIEEKNIHLFCYSDFFLIKDK